MERVWINREISDFERIKLEKDGLDIVERIPEYKKSGFESIDVNERALLKWGGVNVQRPRDAGYFLMRVKIPGGILSSDQARVLARVSQDYGRGILDLTTRQAFQLHWLTIETIPGVMEILNKAQLSTIGAEGDCPRTVMGNPLAGIDPNETMDTHGIVQEVAQYFQGNREFSNLPRKYKISISANVDNVVHAQINDLAFTPAVKKIGDKDIYGFHVHVGGGLSRNPHLAQKLDLFVRPEEVLKVAIAVTTIFRDYGYRKNRHHARLKFLVADWGRERFEAELLKLTGPLETGGIDLLRGWNGGYFYGVHPQKQAGLNYVGLCVPLGRLTPEELNEVARCADVYGDGVIRVCPSKNLVLANIADKDLESLLNEDIVKSFTPAPKPFLGHVVTCTGKEFCNFATVDTKDFAKNLSQTLDAKIQLDTPIRLHVTGCPHSCGQLQIADIGLRGTVGKVNGQVNGQTVEMFELHIGGNLGLDPRLTQGLKGAVPADKVAIVLEGFIRFYQEEKLPQESFTNFVTRRGVDSFQKLLDSYREPLGLTGK